MGFAIFLETAGTVPRGCFLNRGMGFSTGFGAECVVFVVVCLQCFIFTTTRPKGKKMTKKKKLYKIGYEVDSTNGAS